MRMPIHVPMVDVHTVGAGGGSIARVDAAGMLQVGPESAGADARARSAMAAAARADHHRRQSGARPARPERLLSVDSAGLRSSTCARDLRRADRQAARARRRGGRRGRAAARQHEMAGAIRMVSSGARPRPARLRAVCLRRRRPAARVGARARARPSRGAGAGAAGITNALGCVVADLRHDFVNTLNQPVAALDVARVAAILEPQHDARAQAADRRGGRARSSRSSCMHGRHAVRRPDAI